MTPPIASSITAPRRQVVSEVDRFRRDVLAGLSQSRKRLPCKYFYDQRGSELFDRICELPEYYLTRTETSILRQFAAEIADRIGADCLLIEYGSGSSIKTRILLDHLHSPAGYVPIDISRAHLMLASGRIARDYSWLRVMPVWGDYTSRIDLPPEAETGRRKVIFFPGSTIGNFEPDEARQFLRRTRSLCGVDGGLLIGVDLKKDPAILHAAYNDSAGVTAQFNLNLLARINHELRGDFDLDRFAHYAYYNPRLGRIEMHLISLRRQIVRIADDAVGFGSFETVFTESSYKYTLEEFSDLASAAGLRVVQAWLDDRRWFAVVYLRAL